MSLRMCWRGHAAGCGTQTGEGQCQIMTESQCSPVLGPLPQVFFRGVLRFGTSAGAEVML